MELIKGKIKKIIYGNRGDFVIASFSDDKGVGLVVKGLIPGAKEGATYKLEGYFVEDPRYGRQFRIIKRVYTEEEIDTTAIAQMISAALIDASKNGHTFLSYDEVLSVLRERYGIGKELFDIAIADKEIEESSLKIDRSDTADSDVTASNLKLYLKDLYKWETLACDDLKRLKLTAEQTRNDIFNIDFEKIQKRMGLELSEEQKDAIAGAVYNGVTVITGGPGTGKTTILRGIAMLLREMDCLVALAAPTGRAAKRIKESTGYRGQTIHRLLEASLDEKKDEVVFRRDRDNPLEVDAVIVDEASMIDVELMGRLLSACQDGTKLILVGDVDQLPPVGPGSVLKDIIESEYIHTVCLNSIFRQAGESKIVVAAHQINRGEEPDLEYREGDDLIFLPKKTYGEVQEEIARLAAYDETQVITPTKRGDLGTAALNRMLQETLNPPEEWKQEINLTKPNDQGDYSAESSHHGGKMKGDFFRLGDRVMQIKNNYSKPWEITGLNIEGSGLFNGDMGVIVDVDPVEDFVAVEFDEGKVAFYERKEFSELKLSYAITVHKSQGSEFSVVIMPIANVGSMLGTKNMLYTAITRGKDNVVLLGSENALRKMIHSDFTRDRNSGIKDRLMSFLNEA